MLIYLSLFISTFFSVYHLICSLKYRVTKVLYPVSQKGISIIIPCYNEAPILRYTIEGLLKVEYDNFEVIFVNDGSTDGTFQTLQEYLDLYVPECVNYDLIAGKVQGIYKSRKYPFMHVIDKLNSGKADSLNIGISLAKNELIVTMDADCILEKNALTDMNKIFDDDDVIASGGVVHIMQMSKLECKPSAIVMMQALDYIKGFYFYKSSIAYNNAISIISGAFGVFRKSILLDIGGFKTGLGEDIDITIRFQQYAQKHNKKVVFNRNAVCYTECPESLLGLIRQRVRWQKGFIDAIINNSGYLFKNVFAFNMNFFIIVDALISNSFATVVFIINFILIIMKLVYGYELHTLSYYLITIAFNIICSVISIRLARHAIQHVKSWQIYLMILYDLILFQILRVFFFFTGAIAYYFDNKYWYKVRRTSNSYKI